MTILFQNDSFSEIRIFIDGISKNIPANCTFAYSFDLTQLPLKMKLSVAKDKTSQIPGCLYVSTIAVCHSAETDFVITINENTKKYQNHTSYQYLSVRSSAQNISDVRYVADNEENLSAVKRFSGKNSKNCFFHFLKISLADALLDGFLLCVLLALLFSVKVALIAFSAVFALSLTVHLVHHQMTKSKHRVLNWAKDEEMPDDVAYLASHINDFCS